MKKINKASGYKINILEPVIILMHSLPKVMYRFHVIPITIQVAFFFPHRQSYMEPQTIQTAKAILRKNKAGGHTLPAFETQMSKQYGTAFHPVMHILEQN